MSVTRGGHFCVTSFINVPLPEGRTSTRCVQPTPCPCEPTAPSRSRTESSWNPGPTLKTCTVEQSADLRWQLTGHLSIARRPVPSWDRRCCCWTKVQFRPVRHRHVRPENYASHLVKNLSFFPFNCLIKDQLFVLWAHFDSWPHSRRQAGKLVSILPRCTFVQQNSDS